MNATGTTFKEAASDVIVNANSGNYNAPAVLTKEEKMNHLLDEISSTNREWRAWHKMMLDLFKEFDQISNYSIEDEEDEKIARDFIDTIQNLYKRLAASFSKYSKMKFVQQTSGKCLEDMRLIIKDFREYQEDFKSSFFPTKEDKELEEELAGLL